uniref:Expressed protein n=1 Tax=Schizophyllum commune (strain H4-8 / FGSC 9210) TaxID=578458 RepID=D8QLV9_SCHCM
MRATGSMRMTMCLRLPVVSGRWAPHRREALLVGALSMRRRMDSARRRVHLGARVWKVSMCLLGAIVRRRQASACAARRAGDRSRASHRASECRRCHPRQTSSLRNAQVAGSSPRAPAPRSSRRSRKRTKRRRSKRWRARDRTTALAAWFRLRRTSFFLSIFIFGYVCVRFPTYTRVFAVHISVLYPPFYRQTPLSYSLCAILLCCAVSSVVFSSPLAGIGTGL